MSYGDGNRAVAFVAENVGGLWTLRIARTQNLRDANPEWEDASPSIAADATLDNVRPMAITFSQGGDEPYGVYVSFRYAINANTPVSRVLYSADIFAAAPSFVELTAPVADNWQFGTGRQPIGLTMSIASYARPNPTMDGRVLINLRDLSGVDITRYGAQVFLEGAALYPATSTGNANTFVRSCCGMAWNPFDSNSIISGQARAAVGAIAQILSIQQDAALSQALTAADLAAYRINPAEPENQHNPLWLDGNYWFGSDAGFYMPMSGAQPFNHGWLALAATSTINLGTVTRGYHGLQAGQCPRWAGALAYITSGSLCIEQGNLAGALISSAIPAGGLVRNQVCLYGGDAGNYALVLKRTGAASSPIHSLIMYDVPTDSWLDKTGAGATALNAVIAGNVEPAVKAMDAFYGDQIDVEIIRMIGGILMSEGRVITKQQNTVWLKPAANFLPAEWGGKCMRVGDISKPRGALNPTYCQDPRNTGAQLSGVVRGLPGLPTTELAMKELQRDTMADQLENCAWHIDRRSYCKDLDYWNGWEKIRRVCGGYITDRTDQGSAYDEDDTENIVTLAVTGSNDVLSIYRTSVSIDQAPNAHLAVWVAASVCHGERCSSRCNADNECVIAAVSTLVAAATAFLMVNNKAGHPDYWTSHAIAEFDADNAVDVLCLGDFILIAGSNTADSAFVRSYDQGVTQEAIAQGAPMVVNKVQEMDALSQAYIVACGLNGYIYATTDQGTSWEVLDGGVATAEDLRNILICRDNPLVIYAVGDANAIVKSENGGETFFALTGPSVGDDLYGLYILDENHVLVSNDDGELWETSDGGESWTMQEYLPSVTAGAGVANIRKIVGCGCGVLYLIVSDPTALSDEQWVLRNVDGGASGRWFVPEGGQLDIVATIPQTPRDIVCCGPNRALIVGGEATTPAGFAALLA